MKELYRVFKLLFIPKFELQCGLVGCAGAALTGKHERAFKDLLIVDTVRGPHSTGIMAAPNNGDVEVFKRALLPPDLFTMYGCQKLFSTQNHALIGHNRWATKGAINGINAHPFEFKSLVGAHNGTLVNQRLLPDHMEFEVDSENIFHSIEKIGLKDTVASLNGAYALTWYDKANRSVNLIRNKERPMFVTFTEDEMVMFWASESWMLSGVLASNGIKHKDIFDTKIHTHYEFKIPKGTYGKPETYKLPQPIQRAVDPWVAPPVPKYQYPQSTVVNGRFMRRNGETPSTTSTQAGGTEWEYKRGEMVHFFLDPDSPKNKPFLYGLLAHNTTKRVKIHVRRKSWLRGNIECDDVNEVVYQGIVNGAAKDGIIVQENSVYTITPDDVDEIIEQDADIVQQQIDKAKDMPPAVRNDQIIALRATGGTCSWCGDPASPNKEHVYINSDTIICHICKDTDPLAKEFIKEEGL